MSTRTHEKDTGGFRYISVKPAKIAQMEQKDLLFAQRPSEQTVSLRREFERSGNYAERIHFGPRIFNTREWDVQRKWDPKRKASAVADAFLFEMCGQKGCTLSKALQRNRISILEAFQSNNFCNGFYCLTPKDEFHHLQTNYFSWQLLSLLRSHMYKQL